MTPIDLRSDTVTRPSAAMRRDARARAWEIRKRLGGGMRQSGILAAAALYALDHHLGRIVEDHANATLLFDQLTPCQSVCVARPETNIVLIHLARDGDTSDGVVPILAEAGVLVVSVGPRRLRAVTHLDVTRSDVERAAAVIRRVLS